MAEIVDPVAVRELEAQSPDGASTPVFVRFGRPEPDPTPGGDWQCPFQIVGIGEDAVQFAFGVDAVQALQLAFVAVGARLFAAQDPQRTITWLGMSDLGFPEPPEVE
jgi:uncharacterized protein DUF6968